MGRFKLYDPRKAKFLSVDPLTDEYPMLTPYQFASNCPIAGIDLDGLEFLSSEKARIEVRNGGVYLKVSNFIATPIPQQNLNIKNWITGNIGVSTRIGEFLTPTPIVALPKDIPGNHLPSLNRGEGKTTDRVGKYGRASSGMVNSNPKSSKGLAMTEVIIAGLDLAASLGNSYDFRWCS